MRRRRKPRRTARLHRYGARPAECSRKRGGTANSAGRRPSRGRRESSAVATISPVWTWVRARSSDESRASAGVGACSRDPSRHSSPRAVNLRRSSRIALSADVSGAAGPASSVCSGVKKESTNNSAAAETCGRQVGSCRERAWECAWVIKAHVVLADEPKREDGRELRAERSVASGQRDERNGRAAAAARRWDRRRHKRAHTPKRSLSRACVVRVVCAQQKGADTQPNLP